MSEGKGFDSEVPRVFPFDSDWSAAPGGPEEAPESAGPLKVTITMPDGTIVPATMANGVAIPDEGIRD